jgi:hypothetical protein
MAMAMSDRLLLGACRFGQRSLQCGPLAAADRQLVGNALQQDQPARFAVRFVVALEADQFARPVMETEATFQY